MQERKERFADKSSWNPHMLNSQGLVISYIDHLMEISQNLFTVSFFKLNLVFDLWAKEPKVFHSCDTLYLESVLY